MKSSGVWGGGTGVANAPQKFWFPENLGKSPENPGKNSAQRCLTLRNGAKGLHKNTWKRFCGGYTKKRSLWSLWEKIYRQKLHKKFLGKFGEIRAKSFAPKKFACSYTYDEKVPPPLLSLFWKGRGENDLSMPLFSGVPVHIILHALSLLVVSYNVSLQWT